MTKPVWYGAAAVIAITAAAAAPSRAEEVNVAGLKAEVLTPMEVSEPRYEPWGTTTAAVKVIHGLSFQESDSGMTFSYSGATTHRFRTGGGFLWFDAALADLPAGAQLVGLELEGCDTNASQHASALLVRHASPAGGNTIVATVSSGDAATPGCAFFGGPANLPAGEFVNNTANNYFVRVELSAADATTSVGAVRLYYKLRVSPAPAVASFADVPTTNGFFRFVEALAASGITGGCGGGNFCPDTPVTRGQMAVFLATALGLHFPN
jgi:S-layer family protein